MAIMGSGQGFLGLLLLMIPLFILILSSQATAHKFYVGGNEGWVLKPSENYNHWAARTRFLVNDTLYFKYKVGSDSVLVVKDKDYVSCNTKNPIHRMDDGDSEFRLDNSGPFYFISGNVKHCRHRQKLVVVVLGRHTPSHHSPSPSPAATPSVSPSPATPPSVSPSPASPPSVSPSPAAPPSVSPSPATPPSVSPSPSPATPPTVSPSPATSESPEASEGPSGVYSPAPTPSPHHSGSTRFGGSVGVAIGLGVGVALLFA